MSHLFPWPQEASAAEDLGWLPPEKSCPSLGRKQADAMQGGREEIAQSLTAWGQWGVGGAPHDKSFILGRRGGLMLKLTLQFFGHLMRCWETLKAKGDGDDRGCDGWMASPTQWT